MDSNSLILTLLSLKGWGPKKIFDFVSKFKFNYHDCVAGLVYILNDNEKIEFKQQLVNSFSILKCNYEKGIKTINILDINFPEKLYSGSDKCVFLFYKGDISLLNTSSILIIGTRNPDFKFVDEGKVITQYFAKKGLTIVSGLAIGCDTIAHQSCLEVAGKTIAVLPSSCDNPQPSSNKLLAEQIIKSGGLLISEYSSGAIVSKYNYPQRDRIQSLLSSTIIIIQATDSSGTMIAAKKHIKDGKKVYAIKGNNLSLVGEYIDKLMDKELLHIYNDCIN